MPDHTKPAKPLSHLQIRFPYISKMISILACFYLKMKLRPRRGTAPPPRIAGLQDHLFSHFLQNYKMNSPFFQHLHIIYLCFLYCKKCMHNLQILNLSLIEMLCLFHSNKIHCCTILKHLLNHFLHHQVCFLSVPLD